MNGERRNPMDSSMGKINPMSEADEDMLVLMAGE
jgi:hypothetical protein